MSGPGPGEPVGDVEIDPLPDDSLETMAGGSSDSCCSCSLCSVVVRESP